MADLIKLIEELLSIELLKDPEKQDRDKIEFLKNWISENEELTVNIPHTEGNCHNIADPNYPKI